MSQHDNDIQQRLVRIESLLERLVAPVEAEEARQLVTCTDAQLKAHNKSVLQRARAAQKQGAA